MGTVTVSANKFYTSEYTTYFLPDDYLCFTAEGADAWVKFERNTSNLECYMPSKQAPNQWLSYYRFLNEVMSGADKISLTKGEKVYFRGNNPNGLGSNPKFTMGSDIGGTIAASGNIMSLIDKECNVTVIPCENCFQKLFQYCEILTAAPKLPATTLKDCCYEEMFDGCTSLISAPVLSAITLEKSCYASMFKKCSKLNSVTMLATDFIATDCLKDWLVDTVDEGTGTLWSSYDSENAPSIIKENLPANWTVKKYEDSK